MMNRLMKLSTLLIVAMAVLIADPQSISAKESSLEGLNRDLIKVTEKALKAVVNISAIRAEPRGVPDLFRTPHGKPPYRFPKNVRAVGSGVIFDKRGYIVTNNHVVSNTKLITVTLSDGREFQCTIVGTDSATDIALIKIVDKVPADLPVIEIGDSNKISVGEMVIAIGNPFGFSHTVTMGIVSAKGRQDVGLADYENYIQTDAAINPGNSGGALINIRGMLIGINTAIFSKSGSFMGIGFAIPSNMVKGVVDELIARGKVIRGWLGVYIQNVTKDIADSLNFKEKGGVLVSDIIKNSPAVGSGIKVGDIIVSIDNTLIGDVNHLRTVVASKKPGVNSRIKVFRDGKLVEIDFKIGTMPDKPMAFLEKPGREDELGLVIRDIDERLAYQYRLEDIKGVVIVKVKRNSPAADSGLMIGDLIKEMDRRPVDSIVSYTKMLSELKNRRGILLLIKRSGVNKFIFLKIKQ
jgi:serine protease Do